MKFDLKKKDREEGKWEAGRMSLVVTEPREVQMPAPWLIKRVRKKGMT